MKIPGTGQSTRKLLNLIWALPLSKIEAIKTIKMSFSGPTVFIAENIHAEASLYQIHGDNNGHDVYHVIFHFL